MTLTKIILGIAQKSRDAKVYEEVGRSSPLTPEIRHKVLSRDSHTCQFCGFKADKYQEVLALDSNEDNTMLDNLATACIFCHQCFDLDKVTEMKSGYFVWLPEIEQTQLHHIARAIYVARISQGGMAETAKTVLDHMKLRREEAKARIHTDDPYILTTVMRDMMGPKQYAARDSKLEGIRLFPVDRRMIKEGDLEFNQFPQILAYWRSKSGPFGAKAPSEWKNFYAQIIQQV